MGEIIVDRGLEEYAIKDKNGNVLGSFEMNPADIEIAKRFEQVSSAINSISEELDESKDIIDNLMKLEEKVYEQIDYLFNSPVSKSFFSITSPFTVLANGEFFVENVINSISSIINTDAPKRYEKANEKIERYAKKYHK